MSYVELIIALENIVDKVSTVPPSKSMRNDTSAPMEMGMAAKEERESVSQERDQRIMDLALPTVCKGTGKGKMVFWQRRQRWKGWTEELVAEEQRQERRKRQGGKGESLYVLYL